MAEKILIVDDDVDSLKLIGLMLKKQGYEVIVANAGNQALAKADEELPHLIILDIMMPDMNGYEVCRRLRANPKTQPIPIIMFTAKTLVDDKVAGFEAGADDYLTKPTHPAELASRVKSILARSAPQRTDESPSTSSTIKKKVIGVLGAKGGVGTTTVALNVATAFMQAGFKPLIVDVRPGVGNLGLLLGTDQPGGLAKILSKPSSDIRTSTIEPEIFNHKSGLRAVLSSAKPRESRLNFTVEAAVTTLRSLRSIGTPIVVDLGAGLNATSIGLCREIDQIILVLEPVGIAAVMAREILAELDNLGVRKPEIHIVIVNRSQSKQQTPWQEIEEMLGVEIRALISAEPDIVFESANSGVPLMLSQPNAVISSQLRKLAGDMAARMGLSKPENVR